MLLLSTRHCQQSECELARGEPSAQSHYTPIYCFITTRSSHVLDKSLIKYILHVILVSNMTPIGKYKIICTFVIIWWSTYSLCKMDSDSGVFCGIRAFEDSQYSIYIYSRPIYSLEIQIQIHFSTYRTYSLFLQCMLLRNGQYSR